MKRIVFIVCVVLSLVSQVSAGEINAVADQLQRTYESTRTIQADFKQESTLTSMKRKQTATGKVLIKKPGLMRWEYEEPEKQLIVTDKHNMFFYVPEDEQVIKDEVNDLFSASVPAAFLAGTAKLKEKFTMAFDDAGASKKPGKHMLLLTPKEPQPSLISLKLLINKENYQIEESAVTDVYGNITKIVFFNIVINKEISDKVFTFTIPEGVEVVSPPRLQ